jgi:cytochrome d ubiquinol oxidase subunit II
MELPPLPVLDLNFAWFILIGVLLTGYAILDGFDLGVGMLHLFTKTDTERRLMMNSIGPLWDGNVVWLVTGGGALFAAFPNVYAAAFEGFYLPFWLLLAALIFRAVAMEFRSKEKMGWWRKLWDGSFAVGSFLAALLIGVAMGNLVRGIPLNERGEFEGITFLEMLHPYCLMVGVLVVALFAMHGCIYAVMKNEGELQEKLICWLKNCMVFFIISYATVTGATMLYFPRMTEPFREYPILSAVVFLSMLAIANIPREVTKKRYFAGFLSSCVSIILLMVIYAIGTFPNFIYAPNNPEWSLNIYNGASSHKTLWTMFIIALIGMPIVLAYTTTIYWIFRGKTKLDEHSY